MATDNVQASAVIGFGGPKFAGLSDGTEIYVGNVLAYSTGGSPGAYTLQYVDSSHPLPVVDGATFQLAECVGGLGSPIPANVIAICGADSVTGNAASLTIVSGVGLQVTDAAAEASLVTIANGIGTLVGGIEISGGTITCNAGTNLNTSLLAHESGGNLATLATNLPAKGQALAAASMPVVLTAAQLTTLTPVSTVTANAGTNLNTSTLAIETGGNLATIAGRTPALGQAVAAASTPVVLTAAQITTLTPLTTVAVTGTFYQATQPVSGTFWQTTQPVSGTFWQTTQPVSIASLPALAAGSNSIGTVILGAGAASVGTVAATQSGTWTVQPGNTANSTPWLTTQTPATSGGCSVSRLIAAGGANQDATSVKSSAGQVFGWDIYSTTASPRYVKIYNVSAPTSASTPVYTLLIPPLGGNNRDIVNGVAFGTAIGFRITTGLADNDTGTVTANDIVVNIEFK